MFEVPITDVDAARPVAVDGELAVALVAFVRDLTRYAATRDERAARRAIASPHAGLPLADARALAVVAGDATALVETIENERVVLAHDSAIAARRFARVLVGLARAYRAQGANAAEHIAAIALGFDFAGALDACERSTLARIVAIAERCDAARPAGTAWEPAPFIRALQNASRAAVPAAAVAALPAGVRPLERRTPEAPRPVARRKTHFSASSLGTFAECERRWYFRYVCAAVEDRGSSASTYGTAFHWALEKYHQEFPRADSAPRQTLERRLEGYVNTAFERYRSGFPTTVEFELQKRRAQRTARRYLAWFFVRARAHPFTVVGTEAHVELQLDGHTFIGYIDRLDRDDATGAVTVVDYKTGSIATTAQEYRARVTRFADFQLPFYYWARTEAGDRVTRLSLLPLKDATRDVAPVELEVVPVATPASASDATVGTIGIGDLERARTKMIEIASALSDAPIERFAATDDPDTCRYCAYRNACRERPLPREDRFGR